MKNKNLLIIPLSDNRAFFAKRFQELLQIQDADILIVDDASEDGTSEILQETEGIVSIKHALPLGFGACFITGYEYGRDMGYENLIYLDPDNENARADVTQMLANIKYGYDIVSCSRILENKKAPDFPPEQVEVTETIAEALKEASSFDITDPLSGILAVKTSILEQMELTDETHGLLMQLWIQAAYFKLTAIEIPASSGESFGTELLQYDDPVGEILSVIETEKYLYPKQNSR